MAGSSAARLPIRPLQDAPHARLSGSREAVAAIDEEMESLRKQLAEQSATCAKLKQDVDSALAAEAKAKEELCLAEEEKRKRKMKVTRHFQTVVRGWLTRRRLMKIFSSHASEQMGIASQQPDKLKTQLTELQHQVHGMLYTEDSRRVAAIRLQAWWRSVLVARITQLKRFIVRAHSLYKEMEDAAIRIQAWYRGITIHLSLKDEIHAKLEETGFRRFKEMELALLGIVRAQRAVRSWRQQKAIRDQRRQAEERQRRRNEAGGNTALPHEAGEVFVDTWLPRNTLGAVSDERPTTPRDIKEISEAGLVPFYSSDAAETIRHKVGGPAAVRMYKRLFQDAEGAGSSEESDLDDEPIGEAWDVYPKGTSYRFMEELDADAWPKGKKPAYLLSKSSRPKRLSTKPKPRRPTCSSQPPPAHAEQRAQQREETKKQVEAEAVLREQRCAAEPHPLLQNAPTLPQLKPPQHHDFLPVGVPDCTWGAQVGFYGQKKKKDVADVPPNGKLGSWVAPWSRNALALPAPS
mmetsp:Transcript_34489/g.78718  ORF Transcript_34489/g.78718 Transcript_34489/m.78718 type:complete len:520 (+) Transcript_34489:61-1620(+)